MYIYVQILMFWSNFLVLDWRHSNDIHGWMLQNMWVLLLYYGISFKLVQRINPILQDWKIFYWKSHIHNSIYNNLLNFYLLNYYYYYYKNQCTATVPCFCADYMVMKIEPIMFNTVKHTIMHASFIWTVKMDNSCVIWL